MSSDHLKVSCKQVLRRLQALNVEEFVCLLCAMRLRGQDALMEHYISFHKIYCNHFDDVGDLDGYLSCLSGCLHGSCDNEPANGTCKWICPICSDVYQTASSLTEHCCTAAHNLWNSKTIPALKSFCIMVPQDGDAPNDMRQFQPDDAEEDEDWDAEDDESGMQYVCLYCSDEFDDCLYHMKEKHGFDLRAALQQRKDVNNEYDLIRIVNSVRRSVGNNQCPFGYRCLDAVISSTCADDVAVCHSLEDHFHKHPDHRLPAALVHDDKDLIPILPGDALLSLIITSGEGFLRKETEDPDFPMVPTVLELAASRASK